MCMPAARILLFCLSQTTTVFYHTLHNKRYGGKRLLTQCGFRALPGQTSAPIANSKSYVHLLRRPVPKLALPRQLIYYVVLLCGLLLCCCSSVGLSPCSDVPRKIGFSTRAPESEPAGRSTALGCLFLCCCCCCCCICYSIYGFGWGCRMLLHCMSLGRACCALSLHKLDDTPLASGAFFSG